MYSLGSPTAIPQQINTQASYILGYSHTHLSVLLTHPLTVQTSPRYTDVIRILPSGAATSQNPVFMLKQQAPKPFESVGAAGTSNSFRLRKDNFLPYSWRASFCLFVRGTHSALKEEFSRFIQALSGSHHDPDNAQPSQWGYFLFAHCSTITHTSLLSTYTRVRLLEKHLSSLKIDLRVTSTSILEMNHPSNEVQLRSFHRVNAYYDLIIIYVN